MKTPKRHVYYIIDDVDKQCIVYRDDQINPDDV